MPSLFKAIGNFFRAKKNDLAQSIADPVRDGKIAIEDSQKQIQKFTEQIARLMAETKRLEKDHAAAIKEEDKYLSIARKAAEAGNEADARQALEMKKRAEERKNSFSSELEKNQTLCNQLRQQLNRARAKVADAKNNLTRLEARSNAAKLRKDFAKAASEFNDNKSGLAALDDLEKSVNADESEAEAIEELVGSEYANSGDALEEKYGSTSGTAVDDELAALMASTKK